MAHTQICTKNFTSRLGGKCVAKLFELPIGSVSAELTNFGHLASFSNVYQKPYQDTDINIVEYHCHVSSCNFRACRIGSVICINIRRYIPVCNANGCILLHAISSTLDRFALDRFAMRV